MKIANLIEDKIEEMRIKGGVPGWIGLTEETHKKLNAEMRSKQLFETEDAVLTQFLGLSVVTMDGPAMPADGVLIDNLREA